MLTQAGIQHCNTLFQIPTLHLPNKTQISVFSNELVPNKLLRIHGRIGNGFCVFASKSRRNGGISSLRMEEFDDEFDEDEDEDEDEEIVIPLRSMKKWAEKKPRGFGEGKVYDTTIEDQLFDEMERARLAQLANLKKLKNSTEGIGSDKEQLQKQKVIQAAPDGTRVRLVNLPKKKNIHRDLQAAFKGVPGIININPAVSGTKKTRDPVCKGFAFVDFKSKDQANRFVEIYSRQTLAFGKVEKQINCDIVKSSSQISPHEQLTNKASNTLLSHHRLEEKSNPVSDISYTSSVAPLVDTTCHEDMSGDDSDLSAVEGEKQVGVDDGLSAIEAERQEVAHTFTSLEREFAISSQASKKPKKVKGRSKTVAKGKGEKTQKLDIPGSASRLKMKEKSLLTGVFSKYGVQSELASKGHS